MNLLKNVKIRAKLLLLVFAGLLTSISIAGIAIFNNNTLIEKNDTTYKFITVPMNYITDARSNYFRMRVFLYDLLLSHDSSQNASSMESAQAQLDSYVANIRNYYNLVNDNPSSFETYEKQLIGELNSSISTTESLVNQILDLGMVDRNEEALVLLQVNLRNFYLNSVEKPLTELINENLTQSQAAADSAHQKGAQSASTMFIILAAASIVLIVISLIVVKSITIPIKEMVAVAKNISEGKINVNIGYSSKDEIGVLSSAFKSVVERLRNLIDDMSTMSRAHDKGDIDYKINTKEYQGAFKDVAEGTNDMVFSYVSLLNDTIKCLNDFGDGNFKVSLKEFPGEKARLNRAVDSLTINLNNVSKELHTLVMSASDGILDVSIDDEKYKGDWNKITKGLNQLLNAITAPIVEALSVLGEVSHGNLSSKMTGEYKGDFAKLKISINTTIETLNIIIKDISTNLNTLANDDYDVSITKNYPGDFIPIKEGLNKIIIRINNVMSEINTSADQVAAGSRQISESSMNLSQGATEQASALEELNATIDTISTKTRASAETASHADRIAAKAKNNAQSGNDDMKNMLSAMKEISDSSNAISKIIKVIEEIALQTNLLALNAAVEAAHAGSLGKGFTVVADQVRTLASRSKEAAKQTTELINGTIEKVDQGMRIADKTASALGLIVSDVTDISNLIGEIAVSSSDQAGSIDQINIGINQISGVTQTNTATSQEEAASAQELSSQAEIFRNMVSKFKLKKS